jgi:transmembrane sensor
MEHLCHYHTEDFVWDLSFRQWILTPSPNTDHLWNQWLADNPEMACKVQVAREIILAVQCDTTKLDNREIAEKVKEVLNKIS